MPIYCGNNLNDHKLIAGTHTLGNNYQCLRKGIMVGRNLPYDASYAGVYAPVDPRRFYCGNALDLPVGYFGTGSPSKCLSIGVGVGKAQRVVMGVPYGLNFVRYYLPYILFLFIIIGIFTILYFVKPKFVTKKDINNKDIIDWAKFVPYFVIACLVLVIIIWWFWKRFVRRLI